MLVLFPTGGIPVYQQSNLNHSPVHTSSSFHNCDGGQQAPAQQSLPTTTQPTIASAGSSQGGMKTSLSSFGLHSPDNLPTTAHSRQEGLRTIIKQLEDNSGLPYQFAEGTLYLDPDIIDLTMIPPPITPDGVS